MPSTTQLNSSVYTPPGSSFQYTRRLIFARLTLVSRSVCKTEQSARAQNRKQFVAGESLMLYFSRVHSRRGRGDIAKKSATVPFCWDGTIKDGVSPRSRGAAFAVRVFKEPRRRRGKECHITVYCCRPTKRSLQVIRRARCLHSRGKNSPFCPAPARPRASLPYPATLGVCRLRITGSPFLHFPRFSIAALHEESVSFNERPEKGRSSCIKDALHDALTLFETTLSRRVSRNFHEKNTYHVYPD